MNSALALAVTLLLPFITSAAAQVQEKCTSIQFPQGQPAALVKGIARNEEPFACYTLTTRRGQTATIAIKTRGPNDDTAFTIEDVVDNQQKYTFTTEAKTYRILVHLTFARRPPRPFSMQVSVRG